jgi:hypothetical protein
MGQKFVSGHGPDEIMLMPADPREWLPPGHLAWKVIELKASAAMSATVTAQELDAQIAELEAWISADLAGWVQDMLAAEGSTPAATAAAVTAAATAMMMTAAAAGRHPAPARGESPGQDQRPRRPQGPRLPGQDPCRPRGHHPPGRPGRRAEIYPGSPTQTPAARFLSP